MAISEDAWDRLAAAAQAAAVNAHAPYSGFHVGAALLTATGEIIVGCNVENASYGATVCAERNAIGTAVVQGQTKFTALAVITPADHPVAPCGLCRQVLAEFCADLPILLVTESGQRQHVTLDELLPHRFGKQDL